MDNTASPLRFRLRFAKIIAWVVKHHWLLLMVLVGVQYLTGNALTGEASWVPLSDRATRQIHSLNGRLIVIVTLAMMAVKAFFTILRSKS